MTTRSFCINTIQLVIFLRLLAPCKIKKIEQPTVRSSRSTRSPQIIFVTDRNDEQTTDIDTGFGSQRENDWGPTCGTIISAPELGPVSGDRAIAWERLAADKGGNEIKKNMVAAGLPVSVNLNLLIERIYVSPTAGPWFEDVIKHLVKLHNINAPVIKSSLASR